MTYVQEFDRLAEFFTGLTVSHDNPSLRKVLLGSVAQSFSALQNFGGGVFNVKDPEFGAVGDGVTDDTAAIQATIDAAETSGGVVFFPRGTYLIAGTLTIQQDNVQLVGQGTSSIIRPSTAVDVISVFSSSATIQNIVLKDFQINGNGGNGNDGIVIRSFRNVLVRDVLIDDLGGDGIILDRQGTEVGFNVVLDNVAIEDCAGNAVDATAAVAGIFATIRDPRFQRNASGILGFYNRLLITGGFIGAGAYGLDVSTASISQSVLVLNTGFEDQTSGWIRGNRIQELTIIGAGLSASTSAMAIGVDLDNITNGVISQVQVSVGASIPNGFIGIDIGPGTTTLTAFNNRIEGENQGGSTGQVLYGGANLADLQMSIQGRQLVTSSNAEVSRFSHTTAAAAARIAIEAATDGISSVYLGDTGNTGIGRVSYVHSSDTMELWAASAARVYINSNGIRIGGGLTVNLVTKTTAYTITKSDSTIECDATGGAFTVTLPTAVGVKGQLYHIKNAESTANNVTLDGDGAETIDGALNITISYPGTVTVQSNGSNWIII